MQVDGFRRAPWGATKAEILESEPSKPSGQTDTALIYEVRLSDLDVQAFYILVNDTLVRAKYIVTEEYTNEYNYVRAFDRLKDLLVKKYGSPLKDNEYWSDDLWRDDPFKLGVAAASGAYSHYIIWEIAGSRIILYLGGENYIVSLLIEYSSLELETLENEHQEAAALDQL
ncbi:hypothetical protein C5C35_11155 [Rathayibacter sp. AY1F8]|nr:hypothetical protein C5C35_11155 [Rathayibacter sp. AY1F8]